jgi:hypothetical protein
MEKSGQNLKLRHNRPQQQKTVRRPRWFTLENGLKVKVVLLENADEAFLQRHQKPLLRQLRQLFGGSDFLWNDPLYVVRFSLTPPAYAIYFERNLRMMRKKLKSDHPEEAVDYCTATITEDSIQTHVFVQEEQAHLLKTAIQNKTSIKAAALLCDVAKLNI